MTERVFSLRRLTDQPLENGAVRLAESSRGVKLHHFPSMQHQHPVTVHDGVDPGDAQMQTNFFKNKTMKMTEEEKQQLLLLTPSVCLAVCPDCHLCAMVRTVWFRNFSLMVCCSSLSVFWSTLAVASSIHRSYIAKENTASSTGVVIQSYTEPLRRAKPNHLYSPGGRQENWLKLT